MSEKLIGTPKRAHTFLIRIGGDTIEDAIADLQELAQRIRTEGVRTTASGSPSTGHSCEYIHDPEMTHDKYFELNDIYVASLKG